MLLSREKCQLFNQKYELVTIVFNNAELDTLNEKRIALKFYTILVASDNSMDCLFMVLNYYNYKSFS